MKLFFIVFIILVGSFVSRADTFFPTISGTVTSSLARAPQGSQRYIRTAYLLTPTELRAAGFISGKKLTGIGFTYFEAQDVATTGSFNVYLQNTADATYAKASANWTNGTHTGIIDPMTLVHQAALTIEAADGNLDIPFADGADFTYTGGGLYVAFEYQNPAGDLATANIAYCNTDLVGGLRNTFSTTAFEADLTQASDFRPLTRLAYAAPQQGAVTDIYTLGKLLVPGALPHAISARITNAGEAPLINVPVTLTVTGANPYRQTLTIASLAVGSSEVVTFAPMNATSEPALGTNVVSVSIPADDNTADDAKSIKQEVSSSVLGYADAENFSGVRVGYNGGAGLLLAKYHVSDRTTVSTVTTGISNSGTNVGNTVYGVLLDAKGNVLSRSADYVLTSADLGTYHTFTLAAPTSFADTDFYIGLAQTANAVAGYYPLALQAEEFPARAGAYYSAPLAGGGMTEQLGLGRFPILAGVAPTPLPVKWLSLTAQLVQHDVEVRWQTATEQGNDHYEIERATDGQHFAAVGRVAPASATSSAPRGYAFRDAGAAQRGAAQLYYRLKQVDVDGRFAYSPVVAVALPPSSPEVVLAAYPNPVVDIVHVEGLPLGAQVRVTDVTGRLVYLGQAAEATLTLPAQDWARGVYCLQVSAGRQALFTQRLVK